MHLHATVSNTLLPYIVVGRLQDALLNLFFVTNLMLVSVFWSASFLFKRFWKLFARTLTSPQYTQILMEYVDAYCAQQHLAQLQDPS